MKHCDYCGGSNPVLCDGCAHLERTAREQAERRATEAEDSARNATTTMNAAIDDYGRAITKNAHLTAEVERLRAEVATERAARAQAEGRYESAAEMVAAERARAEAAERERDQLLDMLKDAINAAERAHRGYPLPAKEWYALRDAARAMIEDATQLGAKRGTK